MSDWWTSAEGMQDQVWRVLEAGVAEADDPARLVALATTSPDGWPEVRTVVLRKADRASGRIAIHTDLFSDKIASLRKTPRMALSVWHPGHDLQIRLQGLVTIRAGEDVRDLWNRIPDHAQQAYGVTPPPGTPIPDALDYVKSPDPATFAVLDCTIEAIDAVHLGQAHRRIRFLRRNAWQGEWLSP